MLPPTPPPCPLCARQDAPFSKKVRCGRDDEIARQDAGEAYVFTFTCPCGCSFAITVERPEVEPIILQTTFAKDETRVEMQKQQRA